jgi:carboxylate-amine ligase
MADVMPAMTPATPASAGCETVVGARGGADAERVEAATVGVEEEFLLLDAESRRPAPRAEEVLTAAASEGLPPVGTQLKHEFFTSQAEVASTVCTSLAELGDELLAARRRLAAAARSLGLTLISSGTPVLNESGRSVPLTPDDRYQKVADIFACAIDDYEVGGCHVHVGLHDRETAVAVVNHLRPWLPTLLALSVNSPFFEGRDTGYGSWRIMLQSRFPSAGVPPYFTSAAHYDAELGRLLDCGVVADARQSFWLARPSECFPTVELRVADAVARAEEAVLQAALSRALVRTACVELAEGREAVPIGDQAASSAVWAAARYGLIGPGVDPWRSCAISAVALVDQLLAHVAPALEESGDLRCVRGLLDRLVRGGGTGTGTGAERQREAARTGGPEAAVDLLAREAEQAPPTALWRTA